MTKSNVAMMALPLAFLAVSSCSEAQYTRQECIQKVLLDWSNFANSEVEATIQVIPGSIDVGLHQIGGLAIPRTSRNELYLQFREGCEDKARLTKEFLETSISPNVLKMPPYQISDEIVVPGPSTISLRGDAWKDDGFQ